MLLPGAPTAQVNDPLHMPDTLPDILAACADRLATSGTDARRLFHGRGRGVPGFEHVCIDGFPPLVLVTLFRPPDQDVERALLAGLVSRLAPLGMQCLMVQRRQGAQTRADIVFGELPAECFAVEAGLRFRIEPARGQNLGFFPDMRCARDWLRRHAAGKSVLNLFAFTCAFSVVARAAGATRIVNIDLSRASLALGRENHQLNNLSLTDIYFPDHDIFRSWNKLRRLGPYDLMVMDPPTLQKGSFVVEKDYARVVRRFGSLLAEEGDVLACLNAPHLGENFLDDVFARELPGATRVGRLPNPPEFADSDEQAALKVVHYRYRRPPGMVDTR